jgi:hypothetical protein
MNKSTKLDAPSGVGAEPVVRRFKLIRNAAEKAIAIASAKMISASFNEAVNWADLRCIRVYHWTDDAGDSGYTVEIEEAAPESVEFCEWIAKTILEETGLPVEVTTEW